jgi:hypothetical protein
MFPYTEFKNEQPGLGNGWDPSISQTPPAGYIPPPNILSGPPQTTTISSTMSPNQNTQLGEPIYSYSGTEMNGFNYQQQPYYQQQNQYYPPTNNASPPINGGGGNSYIHDATYQNSYQQTQGPTGPPPQGNGLTPTPPPSVQAPQNSPSQPPNSNPNPMSYYQQCNPQQTGMHC